MKTDDALYPSLRSRAERTGGANRKGRNSSQSRQSHAVLLKQIGDTKDADDRCETRRKRDRDMDSTPLVRPVAATTVMPMAAEGTRTRSAWQRWDCG